MSIRQDYASGKIIGAYTTDPALPAPIRRIAKRARQEFIANITDHCFSLAAPSLKSKKGAITRLHDRYMTLDPAKAMAGAQATGDCVSWGVRSAIDCTRCVEIEQGEAEDYRVRQATCGLYAERGHTGQGASPLDIAQAALEIGIFPEEILIDADGKEWDFREYKNYVRLGISLGRRGFPTAVKEVTKKYRCTRTTMIRSMDEADTALHNGYAIAVGANLGVSTKGGYKGVPFLSTISGRWAHEMMIFLVDDSRKYFNDTLYGWDQSWGNWNSSDIKANWPEEYGPYPQGAFVLTRDDTWKFIKQGEATAFSLVDGFPAKDLPDWGSDAWTRVKKSK